MRGVHPAAEAGYNSMLMMTASGMATTPAHSKSSSARSANGSRSPVTLAIDVGGSGLKAMLLDPHGKPISERERVATPAIPTPKVVLAALQGLCAPLAGFDRVSVGFPGVIKRGVTYTAVNLHPNWAEFPLQAEIEKLWKKPARAANDAAIQGYGAVKGEGVEMILTLGTGMGSSLFTDGKLCPGLELGHHPWRKKTYEDYIGRHGLDHFGRKHWNKLLQLVIQQTANTFNWDQLYLGGGNTKKIDFELPKNVRIVSNEEGLLGGVALWRD
jgi:polyphosphate glucokinase